MFSTRHIDTANSHFSGASRVTFFERPVEGCAIVNISVVVPNTVHGAHSSLASLLAVRPAAFVHWTIGPRSPLCRAEHRRHLWEMPERAREGSRASLVGIRDVPSSDPRNCREAQGSSRQWADFLWLLSFVRPKESNSGPLDELYPCTNPNRGHEKVPMVWLLAPASRRRSGNTSIPKLEIGNETAISPGQRANSIRNIRRKPSIAIAPYTLRVLDF
jgi:hypothetical protein